MVETCDARLVNSAPYERKFAIEIKKSIGN
jgi:hypothetical protein